MIHLAVRSEYSFKKAFAPIDKIVEFDQDAIGIADENSTFGFVQFEKKMKAVGKKPIFGVRLMVVEHLKERKNFGGFNIIVIAKNNDGLKEINRLVKAAWDNFYYEPRVPVGVFLKNSENTFFINLSYCGDNQDVINRFDYTAASYSSPEKTKDSSIFKKHVFVDDNNYINIGDRDVYELMAGSRKHGDGRIFSFHSDVNPQHVLSPEEAYRFGTMECSVTHEIADQCSAHIAKSEMVKYKGFSSIVEVCEKGAQRKNIDIESGVHKERFLYELDLIRSKEYEDYFMIVWEMISFAKNNGVLVGTSRGSSAGSLICYLMGITEIDPIKFNLVFERFIDVNRFDLPDIDVDFPDNKRQMIVKYLMKKYGSESVATLANINRFRSKGAIGEFASCLGIPPYETEDVKNAIIERKGGDKDVNFCIRDTFLETSEGKAFIEKHPSMMKTAEIENHASHMGKHAAGVVVSSENILDYCGINSREGVLMMDKHDADEKGLLKIDILGLRTLSIVADCCDELRIPYCDMYNLKLDDKKTYKLIDDCRLEGVFQFEGDTLKMLTRKIEVSEFSDICAITSLARPGALNSGGAERYVNYKNGKEQPIYYGEKHKEITEESMGIVIYQEQMMSIAKEIGNMSWGDVSLLRKAAGKSMGDEFVGRFKSKFLKGAVENGLSEGDSESLWEDIASTGSWTFNKSHAVSYGVISYWTAYMKANHPLVFAVCNLNHAKDEKTAVRFLRDMVKNEGVKYVPVDPLRSMEKWSIQDGMLIGGFENIDGIGESKAKKIVRDRAEKAVLSHAIANKLSNPKTPFDILFPVDYFWGKYYKDPISYGLYKKPDFIKNVSEKGDYLIIGRVIGIEVKDRNSAYYMAKRGNNPVSENDRYFLKLIIEDDSDSVMCMVGFKKFEELKGRELACSLVEDDSWVVVSGKINSDFRMISINKISELR